MSLANFYTVMNTFRDLSKLRRDRDAADLVGMPWEHAQVFMQVALQERCVISSRQLGRVCRGLMAAGYDTKGFRMKSKSCDFGPMAGFICVDERLHKKGAKYNAKQKDDINHSLHGDSWDKTGKWKASTGQICITQARFDDLTAWNDPDFPNARITPTKVNDDTWVGTVTRPVLLHYILHKERRDGDDVWALYTVDKPLPPVTWRAAWAVVAAQHTIKPIEGLVNPYPACPRGHYKNCCTGDYDLFGVWPLKRVRAAAPGTPGPIPYQPLGEDRRIAGMNPSTAIVPGTNKKAVDLQTEQWEDKRLGNISNRVHMVAQMINSVAHATLNGGRGPARDIVHHSDEAGRPFISGIDDHVIAFIPASGASMIVGVASPNEVPDVVQWTAFFRAVDQLVSR